MEVIFPFRGMSYNSYYRIMRNRFIISKTGKEFRIRVKKHIEDNCPMKLLGSIEVSITFHFTDERLRDLDNLAKSIIDATKGILFEDDSQIKQLYLRKESGMSFDRIEMKIRSI